MADKDKMSTGSVAEPTDQPEDIQQADSEDQPEVNEAPPSAPVIYQGWAPVNKQPGWLTDNTLEPEAVTTTHTGPAIPESKYHSEEIIDNADLLHGANLLQLAKKYTTNEIFDKVNANGEKITILALRKRLTRAHEEVAAITGRPKEDSINELVAARKESGVFKRRAKPMPKKRALETEENAAAGNGDARNDAGVAYDDEVSQYGAKKKTGPWKQVDSGTKKHTLESEESETSVEPPAQRLFQQFATAPMPQTPADTSRDFPDQALLDRKAQLVRRIGEEMAKHKDEHNATQQVVEAQGERLPESQTKTTDEGGAANDGAEDKREEAEGNGAEEYTADQASAAKKPKLS